MNIASVFEKKKPVLSFEIFPPKKDNALENFDITLRTLSQLHPDFISITFGAGGSVANNKTLMIAERIKKEYGVEPMVHLSCLNYDKNEICQFLHQFEQAGIKNILALRGDRNPDITPKSDFKYASDLVKFIKEQGDFHVSGACYPEKHLEAENAVTDIRNLKKKVDAGADHLISQLFFDNDVYFDFCEKTRIAGIDVPIEAGVMPVTNRARTERMVNTCGATLPPKFVRILDKYEDSPEALFDAGVAYAINQIVDLIARGADGIHIYTLNKPELTERICDGIKNLV